MTDGSTRRDFLKSGLTVSAAATVMGLEEQVLLAQEAAGEAPAPTRVPKDMSLGLPTGRIGPHRISRMICGGNLIGGYAHSRDLIYVSELLKAYHTDAKVFDTLALAEAWGVNAIIANPGSSDVIRRYWRERGGKMLWISDCAMFGKSIEDGIQYSVDQGAQALYLQGGMADKLAHARQIDVIGEAVETMRRHKLPAGVGAHCLKTVQDCVAAGVDPDFWVKTLHSDDYWSATPADERPERGVPNADNMWCTRPRETIAYMASIKKPWIAFKVLAAGAIRPQEGFRYAFANGADFICVGMFDFQIVEDVRTARRVLRDKRLDGKRARAWMG